MTSRVCEGQEAEGGTEDGHPSGDNNGVEKFLFATDDDDDDDDDEHPLDDILAVDDAACRFMQDGHIDPEDLAASLFPASEPPDDHIPPVKEPLRISIKLPAKSMNLRRSSRHSSAVSGSEYNASEKSADMAAEQLQLPKEETPPPPVEMVKTRGGRTVKKNSYLESSDADGDGEADPDMEPAPAQAKGRLTRTRSRAVVSDEEDEEETEEVGRPNTRLRKRRNSFIATDDDEQQQESTGRYNTRNRSKQPAKQNGASKTPLTTVQQERLKMQKTQAARAQRANNRNRRTGGHAVEDRDFAPPSSSAGSADADGSLDEAPQDTSDLEMDDPEPEPEPEQEQEEEGDGKPYAFRQRKQINYAIPPPLEEMPKPPPRPALGKGPSRSGRNKKPGWSMSGAELGRYMGMPPADDSDSDYPTRTPRKPFGGIAPFGGGAINGGGLLGGDLAAGGTPSNLGKIGDSALADADPLGVNQNVTFDEVGGLDDHIHALKEMTLLPLLYPEVFQRFNVTPPRGVLFHGPPGTGKTLMARALAASCRSGGRQISFFMRKGADCLSKWVGEAERQLRLLFEEARNSQPSIIFFDEIDGLAPVRSSKQDQIHASIVSTLLALMDGMDGRGQVVVIGATNRPDAVDPALRRPGRFDREFYFGLPGLEAREKILGIMTAKWQGWGGDEDEDKTEEKAVEIKERIKGLAKLTKGYGGADLRALCTEAALNAIQRRYPQVYKSNDRLLLKPETIGVGLRDFMISIKKLVPSSARSSSSAATPLPTQFKPLLDETLDKIKAVIQKVMPVEKKLSALEEAEFEDEGGEEGALEKEMLSQAMQTLRIYRPRVVIHGPVGMGQAYLGAAALHHLEGFHVQSLELGALMSDSTRSVEAAIVQLFVEAKRNQPSVIYIPSLVGWCAAVTETSRSTVRAMLDTLAPTDPILLLAVVDGRFIDLPKDVRAWFGPTKDNRVVLSNPTLSQREAFFEGIIGDVQRPPNRFADGMERKKRVLEELPIAPPIEPRKPTAAELAVQEENDQRVLTLLKYRLGPILTELKRKFKRFTKRATEEYDFERHEAAMDTVTTTAIEVHRAPNGVIEITEDDNTQPLPGMNGGPVNGMVMEQEQVQQLPPLYDMDLERMQMELFKGRYLTPHDFLEDVGKILHNAEIKANEDLERLHRAQAMFTAAQVSIQEFDPQLRLECERMAGRERQRREERRKEKEKGKEKEQNVPPPGARRSARHNGQQPEHAITDPVKLERRLKRARGEEGSGGDSHDSGAELNGNMAMDEGRDAKRTRIIIDDDDDRDPLDTLAASRPPTDSRPHNVRFASDAPPGPPLPSLMEVMETQEQSFSAQNPQPYFPQAGYPQQNGIPMNHLPQDNLPQNHHQMGSYPPQPLYPVSNHAQPAFDSFNPHNHFNQSMSSYPDHMTVDEPAKRATGFDNLLNPVQPSPGYNASYSQPQHSTPYNSHFPTPATDPSDPFMSLSHPQQPQFQQGYLDMPQSTATPPPQQTFRLHTPANELRPPSIMRSRHVTPVPVASSSTQPQEPSPVPMVERTPTPPLPEFHVSEILVSQLRNLFKTRTSTLNVEQLEQLRATSLGTVWRHRKEWNRDDLVQELIRDVNEFIDEVNEDADGEEEDA